MAKRFTDSNKWKKKFFRGLQAPYKLAWIYLLDECNHAGVWDVEFDVLKIRTGFSYSEEELLKVFKDKIFSFDDNSKWFIPAFIDFQYGDLNPKNKAHNSVILLLTQYKNKGLNKGLPSPLEEAKDKYMDKDKDKDKEEVPLFENFKSYAVEKKPNISVDDLKLKYESWKTNDWRDGNDKKIKNWKSKLLNTLPYIKENAVQQKKYLAR